jgi:2-keto-4-pentenoate hydratase
MLDERTMSELAQRLQRAEDEKQFIRMFLRKGDTFHADYGPYGSVSCHFA